MKNKLFNFTKKYSIVFIIVFYIVTNALFNYKVFWSELYHDSSLNGAVIGELNATEWGMEQIYNRLVNFESPFKPLKSIFYPFEIDISTGDVGFAFHFLYLRPFLSPHQALSFLVILNMFLANIFMYALIRKLNIDKLTSFLIGLAFGFITFMSNRMGHLTYSLYYIFPLFYLSYLYFINARSNKSKIIFTLTTSAIFVFAMWQHMYYFIMLLISITSFGLYFLVTKRQKTFNLIKENLGYIFLSLLTIILLLIPWIKALKEVIMFSQPPQGAGWGGAIGFSSDLLGYFVPSVYNYYYGDYVTLLINKFDITFAKGIFENFTYPGIIILSGYAYIIFQKLRKKLNKKLWKNIKPFFVTSMVFLSLTLGPFLHIAGRWALPLDEGIRVIIPLPYVILHYLPFLANIRTPGRFIVAFIFFAYITIAFLLSWFLRGKSKKTVVAITILFIFIFVIDQRYQAQSLTSPHYFPKKIYKEIDKDKVTSTVLEIPFTVRDGFTYFGDKDAVYQIMGQFTFDKPLIGGYTGRVPNYVKNYYEDDPFIGYLGRQIDEGVHMNGSIDREKLNEWNLLNKEQAEKSINFLSIKHIVFNKSKPYYSTLSAELKSLGYEEKMKDGDYILFERSTNNDEFIEIDMEETLGNRQLGMGWLNQEDELFAWSEKKSNIFFKLANSKKQKLYFTAESFVKPQKVEVFINKKYVGQKDMTLDKKDYKLIIPFELTKGINTVYFIFDEAYKHKDILGGDNEREFSAKFYNIRLIDQ